MNVEAKIEQVLYEQRRQFVFLMTAVLASSGASGKESIEQAERAANGIARDGQKAYERAARLNADPFLRDRID